MKTKEQIEEEFDEKFVQLRGLVFGKFYENGEMNEKLKSHTSSLRKNDIESVREWVEKLDIDEIFAEQVKEKIVSHLSEELKNLD